MSPRKVHRGAGLPCQAVAADDGWKYEYVRSPHQTYTEDFFPIPYNASCSLRPARRLLRLLGGRARAGGTLV